MKLVGVYLSPYVRRVAAALISRGLPYEHEPVNAYREFEVASRYNPVAKVPALVLDDGEILIDSSAILDYLNELVPSAPLIPAGSRARRATLKLAAIGYGICEQAVRLSAARRNPAAAPESDTKRWRAQVIGGLSALDAVAGEGGALRAAPLDAAGITAIVAVELVARINPDLEFLPSLPRLPEFVAQHRETPPFAKTRPTL
jgi:glutathione S-transferase